MPKENNSIEDLSTPQIDEIPEHLDNLDRPMPKYGDLYSEQEEIAWLEFECKYEEAKDPAHNNGGSTDYYKLKSRWTESQDIIEDRKMNYAQGNIFKVAFTFNIGRHDAASEERDLNKIIWFAQRRLNEIRKL